MRYFPAADFRDALPSPHKRPAKAFGMWVGGAVDPVNGAYGMFAGNVTSLNHTAFWTRDTAIGPFNYFETGTVDETSAGMRSTTNHISAVDQSSYWYFKFRGGAAVTSAHHSIGIWNNTSFPADNPLNNQSGVILSFRDGSNSNRLRVLHNNGAVTQTTINLSSDFEFPTDVADKVYTFELQFADTSGQFDYRVTRMNFNTLSFVDTGWQHVSSLGPATATDLGWTSHCITKVAANNVEHDAFLAYCECAPTLI